MSKDNITKILEEVDNYEQSLNASLTFIHIFKWNTKKNAVEEAVDFWIGNQYEPGEVTPDITIQLSQSRGIVTELKKSIPKNDDASIDKWKPITDQLAKYDVPLVGWNTPSKKVDEQELVFLIDQKLSRLFIKYIQEKKLTFSKFSKHFCVIQFSPGSGLSNAVFLRAEHGTLDDFDYFTKEKLDNGITVALEYLIYSGLLMIKFLDYRPPVVYLMSTLWDHVFSHFNTDWDATMLTGKTTITEIPITIKQVQDVLSANYTSKGAGKYVRDEWVLEALDKFVDLKLATKEKVVGKYTIKWRKKIGTYPPETSKNEIFAEMLFKKPMIKKIDDFIDKPSD